MKMLQLHNSQGPFFLLLFLSVFNQLMSFKFYGYGTYMMSRCTHVVDEVVHICMFCFGRLLGLTLTAQSSPPSPGVCFPRTRVTGSE